MMMAKFGAELGTSGRVELRRANRVSVDLKPKRPAAFEWGANVKDLHRVLAVAQSLYLTLSQHDEAILRVALELITTQKTKHIFKWMDDWYDDDVRRNWFGNVVQQQLTYVKDVRSGTLRERTISVDDNHVDQTALRAALARAEEAEAALGALRLKLTQAQRMAQDATDYEDQLELKGDEIRRLIERLKQASASLQSAEARCKLSETQKQEALTSKAGVDANLKDAMLRMRELEEDAATSKIESKKFQNEAAQYLQEVAALRKELDDLKASRSRVAESEERIQELTAQLQSQKAAADSAEAEAADCQLLRATSAGLQKKVAALEAELKSLRAKYSALEAGKKAEQASVPRELHQDSGQKKELHQEPSGSQQKGTDKNVQTDPPHSLEEDKKDKLAAPEEAARPWPEAKEQQAALDELQGKVEELTKENKRLKVVLEELQQKLKELMGAFKKKGVDVDAIANDLGLTPVLEVETVWDRLYDDARTRIVRMEKLRSQYIEANQMDLLSSAGVLTQLEDSDLAAELAAPIAEPAVRKQAERMSSIREEILLRAMATETPTWSAECEAPVRASCKRLGGRRGSQRSSRERRNLERTSFHMRRPGDDVEAPTVPSRHCSPPKRRALSPEQLASSGFGRKSKMELPTGVHSHYVPRRVSKMGSSLGFSQAITFIKSGTAPANAGAAGQPQPMHGSRSDVKHLRPMDDFNGPKQRDRKVAPGLRDRMARSLPSLHAESSKFRLTK